MLQPTLWLPGSPKWHSRVMGVGAWQSRDTRSAKNKTVTHPKEKQQKITYMYKVQLVCFHVSWNSDICAHCTNVVLEYSWSPPPSCRATKRREGRWALGWAEGTAPAQDRHRSCSILPFCNQLIQNFANRPWMQIYKAGLKECSNILPFFSPAVLPISQLWSMHEL